LNVRQVAERLEISISLVYALIAAGKIPTTRHGLGRGTYRISEEQLAEYLARAGDTAGARRRPTQRAGQFRYLDSSKLQQAWQRRG
jgi:excisionase family DNA binding protein